LESVSCVIVLIKLLQVSANPGIVYTKIG
jgi:hypothetical protein